jgi:hypothetical protein
MKLKTCAVFDSAIQAFGQPIFVPHLGAAMRSFNDEINRKGENNPLNQHPDDFELYFLAEYDDETGTFSNDEPKRLLTRGKDVKS